MPCCSSTNCRAVQGRGDPSPLAEPSRPGAAAATAVTGTALFLGIGGGRLRPCRAAVSSSSMCCSWVELPPCVAPPLLPLPPLLPPLHQPALPVAQSRGGASVTAGRPACCCCGRQGAPQAAPSPSPANTPASARSNSLLAAGGPGSGAGAAPTASAPAGLPASGCAGGSTGGVGAAAASSLTGLVLRGPAGRGASHLVPKATCGFWRLLAGETAATAVAAAAGGGGGAAAVAASRWRRPRPAARGSLATCDADGTGERSRLRSWLLPADGLSGCMLPSGWRLRSLRLTGRLALAAASPPASWAGPGCCQRRGHSCCCCWRSLPLPAAAAGTLSRAAAMRWSTSAATAAEKSSKLVHTAADASTSGTAVGGWGPGTVAVVLQKEGRGRKQQS